MLQTALCLHRAALSKHGLVRGEELDRRLALGVYVQNRTQEPALTRVLQRWHACAPLHPAASSRQPNAIAATTASQVCLNTTEHDAVVDCTREP